MRACDTTGTATNDGYSETAYNLDVAFKLRTILEGAGAHVVMTRSDLGGLDLSTIPTVFVETAHMRNAADAALLKSDAFRQRAAMAIASGLASYLAGQ